jgi:hypothetical protein
MHKSLCAVILLLPTFVAAQAAKPAPATFTSPQIVAKGKLPNQTTPIPTTTIFTPTQTGLYRLSAYATLTTANPNSGGYWNYTLGYTDDAGVQSISFFLYANSNTPGPFEVMEVYPSGGVAQPFEAKAGTPIIYSMAQPDGPDGTIYSLYYVLERLE